MLQDRTPFMDSQPNQSDGLCRKHSSTSPIPEHMYTQGVPWRKTGRKCQSDHTWENRCASRLASSRFGPGLPFTPPAGAAGGAEPAGGSRSELASSNSSLTPSKRPKAAPRAATVASWETWPRAAEAWRPLDSAAPQALATACCVRSRSRRTLSSSRSLAPCSCCAQYRSSWQTKRPALPSPREGAQRRAANARAAAQVCWPSAALPARLRRGVRTRAECTISASSGACRRTRR
mmetsp:Transcript_114601/g.335127  ORF Transcript_114601/g.335127 Transcript_114601/m.335127 type:complete len:234 (+) Transcript_114601:229-930(+)